MAVIRIPKTEIPQTIIYRTPFTFNIMHRTRKLLASNQVAKFRYTKPPQITQRHKYSKILLSADCCSGGIAHTYTNLYIDHVWKKNAHSFASHEENIVYLSLEHT